MRFKKSLVQHVEIFAFRPGGEKTGQPGAVGVSRQQLPVAGNQEIIHLLAQIGIQL